VRGKGEARCALQPEGFLTEKRANAPRIAAIATLVAVALLVGVLMFGGGAGYTVAATFENAGQLVPGNYVEVGGRPVGKIKDIYFDDLSWTVRYLVVDPK